MAAAAAAPEEIPTYTISIHLIMHQNSQVYFQKKNYAFGCKTKKNNKRDNNLKWLC